jgi:hypothetical protein
LFGWWDLLTKKTQKKTQWSEGTFHHGMVPWLKVLTLALIELPKGNRPLLRRSGDNILEKPSFLAFLGCLQYMMIGFTSSKTGMAWQGIKCIAWFVCEYRYHPVTNASPPELGTYHVAMTRLW